MNLKVIGVGFGRTATESLRAALEQLGVGRCHHMHEVLRAPATAPALMAAARVGGVGVDWDALLAGYAATTDWPTVFFYKQLLALNPSAKVVLTVRDPEPWYESMLETIHAVKEFSHLGKDLIKPLVSAVIWHGTFGEKFLDKKHAIKVFKDHIEMVKRTVSAHPLLVFRLENGWGLLCEFLGVPIPLSNFPHMNDRSAFAQKARGIADGNPESSLPILTVVEGTGH